MRALEKVPQAIQMIIVGVGDDDPINVVVAWHHYNGVG
jgi:hypothetical protein